MCYMRSQKKDKCVLKDLEISSIRAVMCNSMAREPHVSLQTVFCGPQVRWAVGKKYKTAFDK